MIPDIAPERIEDARSAALQLLDRRTDQATICPSEVARMVAGKAGADPKGPSWRAVMPVVHAAIDQLVAERLVERIHPLKAAEGQGERSCPDAPVSIARVRSAPREDVVQTTFSVGDLLKRFGHGPSFGSEHLFGPGDNAHRLIDAAER